MKKLKSIFWLYNLIVTLFVILGLASRVSAQAPNQAPTEVVLNVNSFDENVPTDTYIGAFTTSDPDLGNIFTYQFEPVGGLDNDKFKIVGSKLLTNFTPFDYETQNIYTVNVKSTDQGGLSVQSTILLYLNDINEAPTGLTLDPASVFENETSGTFIGTFNTIDEDIVDNFTYTLEGGYDNASFQIVDNELQTNASFNYEVKNSYTVNVRTTDKGGLWFESTFTISVLNVKEAPYDITLTPSTIAENATGVVGTLAALDSDLPVVHTFNIVGGADYANFSITNNQLGVVASFDYETQKTAVVEIKATDIDNLSYTEEFTINITNEWDCAPTAININASSFKEDAASGTLIGTFNSVDADEGDAFTYAFYPNATTPDNNLFSIAAGNELRTNSTFDYETKNIYTVNILTTDNGLMTFNQTFTINVTDVNEAPTGLALGITTFNENSATGTNIGTFTATDPDGDALTFTLAPTTSINSYDNANFKISGNQLQTNASFDFETKFSYQVYAIVTDPKGLSDEQLFTVTVVDVNEAPTAMAISSNSIDENAIADIGTLSTTDQDAGDTFVYTITGGADNAKFSITNDKLGTVAALDYETQKTYEVIITVADNGGLTYAKTFTINANSLNDNSPTNIGLSANTLDENKTIGTNIGTLTTTDGDLDDTHTYSLVDATGDNAAFQIAGDKLQNKVVFDYETQNIYTVNIRTTDMGGITFDKLFTVNVNDVNEVPTNLTINNLNFDENIAASTSIATFNTVDPDAGDTFTYSFSTVGGAYDNAKFLIATDKLQTNAAFDHETKSIYTVNIRTTDQGGLFIDRLFYLNVVDINEAPTAIAVTPNSINENLLGVVGTLSATDQDAANTFVYTFETGGTDNAMFSITNDKLGTVAILDYETKHSYEVKIKVTDQGGLSYAQTLTINVNNLNDNPPTDITLSTNTFDEEQPIGHLACTLSTDDPDAGDMFTYNLVPDEFGVSFNNNLFKIVDNQLQTNADFDYETQWRYFVNIKTSDQTGASTMKAFVLYVNDINETPTGLAISSTSIDENLPPSSVVGTFSATDVDTYDKLTYRLSPDASNNSFDNAMFAIQNNELWNNQTYNHEVKSSYQVNVRVYDIDGLYQEQLYTITVNDVPEAPTAISLSNNTIDENLANTTIGTFTTTDPDNGESFTYSFETGGADNGKFAISGNALKTVAGLDYETQQTYQVKIKVTDKDNLTYSKLFTINATNLNDNTPVFSAASFIVDVDETQLPGVVFETYPATDADGTLNTLTYSVIGDNAFALNAKGGLLITNSTLVDYETKTQHTFQIRVSDGTNSSVADVTVNINNIDDEAPVFDAADYSFNIYENTTTANLGAVTATNPDGAAFSITYSVNDPKFAIDSETGELTFADGSGFDYETTQMFYINVTATDTKLSTTQKVKINVLDVNEAPKVNAINDMFLTEDDPQQQVNLSGISDGDSKTTQNITIEAISSNPALIPNPTVMYSQGFSTGKLLFTPVAEMSGNATITVKLTDNGGTANGGIHTFETTFTVYVDEVYDDLITDEIQKVEVNEASTGNTAQITGIKDINVGANIIDVDAASDSPIIKNVQVSYTQNDPVATFTFDAVDNNPGTANIVVNITVSAQDGNHIHNYSIPVTVLNVQDIPTISNVSKTTKEDALMRFNAFDFILTYKDLDNEEMTSVKIETLPQNGTLQLDNKTVSAGDVIKTESIQLLTFTPNQNWNGNTSFNWSASDSKDFSNTAAFDITYTAVNDAPILNMVEAEYEVKEFNTVTLDDFTFSDVDADEGTDGSITITMSVNNGELEVDGTSKASHQFTGTVTELSNQIAGIVYSPNENFHDADTWTVTINDNGNTGGNAIEVSQSRTINVLMREPIIDVQPEDHEVCIDENVTISASASGSEPIVYQWYHNGTKLTDNDNIVGSTTEAITLSHVTTNMAGTYYCVATNGAGRAETETAELLVNRITLDTEKNDVACFGTNTGSIVVMPSNGTMPYEYSIDGSAKQSSNQFTNLATGQYTIVVNDAKGCQATVTLDITQPQSTLSAMIVDYSEAEECAKPNTGWINVQAQGGTAPYSFKLGDMVQTESMFENVAAGVYSVNVVDSKGCEAGTKTIEIIRPANDLALSETVSDIQCYGADDAVAEVDITGGNAPFDVYWENPLVSKKREDVSNGVFNLRLAGSGLPAGDYHVWVIDKYDCKAETMFSISEPKALSLNLESVTDVGCEGDTDGSITVFAQGGTSPVSYAINNGDWTDNPVFSNLESNQYVITAKDANDCQTEIGAYIAELQRNPIADFKVTSQNGGRIEIQNNSLYQTANSWLVNSETIETTDLLYTFTADGLFDIKLTVSNDCGTADVTKTINIVNTAIENSKASYRLDIYPNPAQSSFNLRIEDLTYSGTVLVSISDLTGRTLITDEFEAQQSVLRNYDMSNLSNGAYMVEVKTPTETRTLQLVISK